VADYPLTSSDAHTVHHAFQVAYADAEERERKGMASSAEAVRAEAANLKQLRDKILSTMPELHFMYPDYTPPESTTS